MNLHSLICPACGAPVQDTQSPNEQFSCKSCSTILVLTNLATDDLVVCHNCETTNLGTRRFCRECGAPLQVGCPFCYAMNPVDEEFCGNCGANVQNARSRKVFWLEEKRRHDEERWVRLRQAEAESRKTELNRLLKELEEPENHTMAIFCLHQFGVEAVEGLLGLLQTSDDPDARFGAAQTLGRIGDPRAVESLIAALRDPEPVVRYWAVDSLGRMRVESVAKEIGNMVEDEHKGVAAHAVKILRGFKTMEAKRVLREKRSWL